MFKDIPFTVFYFKNLVFFEKIIKKSMFLRFKMVWNGKIFKNFDEITHKTPNRLFFEMFGWGTYDSLMDFLPLRVTF